MLIVSPKYLFYIPEWWAFLKLTFNRLFHSLYFLYNFERLLSIYSCYVYRLWSLHRIIHPWACLTPGGWHLSPPPLGGPPLPTGNH